MARYRVEVEFDTETGDYSLSPHNLDHPGEGMDYHMIKEALRRIFGDFINQREGEINRAVKQAREDN